MEYIKACILKEFKSMPSNKKQFILLLFCIPFIIGMIIRSRNEFEPTGFHSILYALFLLSMPLSGTFLTENYFADKQSGIENLLVLNKKFGFIVNLRIILYSVLNVILMLLTCLLFKVAFGMNILQGIEQVLLALFVAVLLPVFIMETVLLINEKTISMYVSTLGAAVVIFLCLYLSDCIIDSLVPGLRIAIFALILAALVFLLEVTVHLTHRIAGE